MAGKLVASLRGGVSMPSLMEVVRVGSSSSKVFLRLWALMKHGGCAREKQHGPARRADIGARGLAEDGPDHPAESNARDAKQPQPDRKGAHCDQSPDQPEINPVLPDS